MLQAAGTRGKRYSMPNARIMMVGDSITEGGSDTRIRLGQLLTSGGQSYQFVGSRLNAGIYHEGYSGYAADGIDNLITAATQNAKPDIVMMMIGTNDVLRSMSLDGSIKNINSIITKIHQVRPNAMVFVAKILPNTRETAADVPIFNAALEASLKPRVAAGANIVIVDMNTGFSGADLLDGIHPGGGGFNKMAERWFSAL
ncbi:MAG: GDSL family lipase, partial [Cytophagaceae bacterium]